MQHYGLDGACDDITSVLKRVAVRLGKTQKVKVFTGTGEMRRPQPRAGPGQPACGAAAAVGEGMVGTRGCFGNRGAAEEGARGPAWRVGQGGPASCWVHPVSYPMGASEFRVPWPRLRFLSEYAPGPKLHRFLPPVPEDGQGGVRLNPGPALHRGAFLPRPSCFSQGT